MSCRKVALIKDNHPSEFSNEVVAKMMEEDYEFDRTISERAIELEDLNFDEQAEEYVSYNK
ncbi:hypothetical protein EON65_28695 [archaeon]|nr:MAG: hypothetical protein EON65_28695 [archaeon]